MVSTPPQRPPTVSLTHSCFNLFAAFCRIPLFGRNDRLSCGTGRRGWRPRRQPRLPYYIGAMSFRPEGGICIRPLVSTFPPEGGIFFKAWVLAFPILTYFL